MFSHRLADDAVLVLRTAVITDAYHELLVVNHERLACCEHLARSQRGLDHREPVDLTAVVNDALNAHQAYVAAREYRSTPLWTMPRCPGTPTSSTGWCRASSTTRSDRPSPADVSKSRSQPAPQKRGSP